MKENSFNLEKKIIELLERFCRILKIMQWDTAKKLKLSPLQSQFLIFLSEYPREFRTTLNLSKEFGVSPPTVSDSIKVLQKKDLIKKERNPEDKRNYNLVLTEKGYNFIKNLKDWDSKFCHSIKLLNDKEKKELQALLFKMLINLQSTGLVLQMQACLTCKSFVIKGNDNKKEYYCKLTKKKLKPGDIKFKCNFYLKEKGADG